MMSANFKYLLYFISGVCICFFPELCFAHEPWMLTPNEVDSLNASPKPSEFLQLTWVNALLTLMTLCGLAIWIYLDKKSRKWQDRWQDKWSSYSVYGALFLRYGTAAMLMISAFGLIPRDGYPYFTSSLFTPDLILTSHIAFFKWLQVVIAVAFIFGIYIRFFAVILFLLVIAAAAMFGVRILPYFGFYIGISIYLILQGAQIFSWHLPTFNTRLQNTLALQPVTRAQWFLQMFVGLSFIFSSLIKFIYPNLTMGILFKSDAFTFGIPHGAFVFLMALVEMASGVLILTGSLLRVLALFLFFLFTFLSIDVKENILAHIFIYGILLVFIINGKGRWRK